MLQNASTSELWRRTMIYTERQLAAVLGRTQADARRAVRLAFCRVAEFQRRGVVHLHAIVRADGPDGSLPPVDTPDTSLEPARKRPVPSPWPIRRGRPSGAARSMYKSSSTVTSVLGVWPPTSPSTPPRPRATTLALTLPSARSKICVAGSCRPIYTAWWPRRSSSVRIPRSVELNLARHAHRLGYGGHFLTKSRRYSTTFGALRDARVQWREARRLGDDVRRAIRPRVIGTQSGRAGPTGANRSSPPTNSDSGPRRREKRSWRGTPGRIARCSEAKPPQAVRQGFVVAPPTSSSRHL